MPPTSQRDPPAATRTFFPTFLLPTLKVPFHRRGTSVSSISSLPPLDSASSSRSSSIEVPASLLEDYSPLSTSPASPLPSDPDSPPTRRLARTQPDTIRCSSCSADLAFSSQIVSKGFTGRYGRAYLMNPPTGPDGKTNPRALINVRSGLREKRLLATGWHTVADLTCAFCRANIGWVYHGASEASQHYKIGKFILETERIVTYRTWEDVTPNESTANYNNLSPRIAPFDDDDRIVFDSDDEDECEDIFSGTWDPDVVARRRSEKVASGLEKLSGP